MLIARSGAPRRFLPTIGPMLTPARVLALLALVFASLVAAGITGSSLQLSLSQNGLVRSDAKLLLGHNRPVRSDEWLVLAPMAIAQANHRPRFPVVNANLGPDGQNMLVVGMAGVAVAHVSAIAKPASWGFFFLDLRRALAWHWWLPPFACLIALWGVMRILAPGRPWLGLASAAAFVGSGYVVAWSNWPAYLVLFPAAAFCVFFKMLETAGAARLATLAVGLGVSLAGFVFVLYPPWQVSVGYLFLMLAFGVALRDRLWRRLDAARLLALLLSAAVLAGLCWAWWSDAESAIEAMRSTLYPGRRTAVEGGGMFWWMSFRGFLNPHTLYEEEGLLNASESGAFFYFFPVAIAAACIRASRGLRPCWPQVMLIAFCFFVLWFQHLGIGKTLAEWSLWGRVVPARADLALGLASVLLCVMSLASPREADALKRTEAALIALLWAAAATLAAMQTPQLATGRIGAWLWIALPSALFALSWWLLANNAAMYLAGLLALTWATAAFFNPLVCAPSEVAPSSRLPDAVDRREKGRILVVGPHSGAMALLAAGLPVANGVFFYPQPSLWRSLDPQQKFVALSNRYQHLVYEPAATRDSSPYEIELPSADRIRIVFDPARFDFRRAHADRVAAPAALDLSRNPALQPVPATHSDLRFYRVKADDQPAGGKR